MKKCLFLVYHQDVDAFLERIREAGAVHVVLDKDAHVGNQSLVDRFQKINEVSEAIKSLERLEVKNGDTTPTVDMGEQAFEIANAVKQRREQVRHDQQRTSKDHKTMSVWGDFSFDTVNKLEEAGWITGFYSCSPKKFQKEWETAYNAFVINKVGSALLFVTFTKEDISGTIEAESVKLADRTLAELNWRKKHLVDKYAKIDEQEQEIAESSLASMRLYLQDLKEHFDFESIQTGCSREVDERVFLLEGYVPCNKEENVKQMLASEDGVYYEMHDPSPEDTVPVKLKNNSFNSLFEAIGGLYNLPNYKELDMTPFMAPFYLVFFGFCLQDIGYGLILFFAGLFLRKKMPNIAVYLKLATLFGISSIVFGIVVGNVFGVDLKTFTDVAWLSPYTKYMLDTNDMFNFALILGVIQIVFGMAVKVGNVIKQKGFKYALAPLAWVILIVGMIAITLLSKNKLITPEMTKLAYYIVGGVCAFFILFLNNPSKNPLHNMGEGLWEIYEKSTGLMGDLMSYTRLFALGVSGAVLGFVFNELAIKMSPDFLPARILVMIVILAFGHGLTIFMSCLGSFVHPVRLTFVEFYKNTGFAGTGKAYIPFAKKEKTN